MIYCARIINQKKNFSYFWWKTYWFLSVCCTDTEAWKIRTLQCHTLHADKIFLNCYLLIVFQCEPTVRETRQYKNNACTLKSVS